MCFHTSGPGAEAVISATGPKPRSRRIPTGSGLMPTASLAKARLNVSVGPSKTRNPAGTVAEPPGRNEAYASASPSNVTRSFHDFWTAEAAAAGGGASVGAPAGGGVV